MINTSNEYKKYIAGSIDSTLSRDFRAKADIELVDGTVLNITEGDIVLGGLKINDATSTSNSFQVGSAIINQCTLMLNNIGGKFDQYDFTDAIIRPYIGLKLSETTEWIKKGIFTVDEPTVASSIISLVALDNMNKFDTPFSDVAISFPCTQLQLLQEVCLHCGVSLTNATFTNSNFIVTRRPDDEAITCREIVAWIAQNSGNFARINIDGDLELKWYDITAFEQSDSLDGGIFDGDTPYSSGDNADGGDFTFSETTNYDGGTFLQTKKYHHIYALNQATVGTDDVIITGVQVKAQGTESDYGETVLFGTKGYVIEITNPLITENTASIIANSVGAKIVGMRFRPCDISALSDPSREAGDVAYLSHKNNTYQTLLTNVSYQIGSSDSISCDAETPSRKQSVRFDASTKAIVEARKQAKQEISNYDLAIQQLTNLMTNSFGVFKSEEILEDGSKIYYMHDKPTIAESQTIWEMTANTFTVSTNGGQTWNAGIDSSGNAVVNVLNAIGINAEWINVGTLSGIIISNGNGTFYVDKNGNVTANSFNSTNAKITGGIIDIVTSSEDYSAIKLKYSDYTASVSPYSISASQGNKKVQLSTGWGVTVQNSSGNIVIQLSSSKLRISPDGGGSSLALGLDASYMPGHLTIGKNLLVEGTKNRIVKTQNYGDVLHYALESPTPMFTDIGQGITGEDGLCYIDVESIFSETVDLVSDYHIQLTKYGEGNIWVKEKQDNYFIVEGTPNLDFAWEIKAKQKGYSNERLEKYSQYKEEPETDYIELANAYLKDYERELISA